MTVSLIETEYQAAKQWKSYAAMLVTSIIIVCLAWVTGYAFNRFYPPHPIVGDICEFTGYVLWGTGMAKPKMNHILICARSKALNRNLQLFCAEAGIFSFVLARTLES